MTCRSMYHSNKDIVNFNIPRSSVIYGDMIRYSYIQLCSILDEIVVLNRLGKDNEYLKDTLYIISPVTRAINQYSGIRKARNFMLAHFNRDKKRNFHPWWKALKGLKLPRTQKEIQQIQKWIHLINGILVTRYYEELKEISKTAEDEIKSYSVWMFEEEKKVSENPTPFDSIENQVAIRMEEKGVKEIMVDPSFTDIIEYIQNKN